MERPMRFLSRSMRDDLDFDFLADLEHFAGMIDAFPGDLGEVHQAISAADVDESAKFSQAGNTPGADIAFVQVVDDAFLEGFAGFGGSLAFGEDQAAAFAVHFDDAERQFPG